MDRPNERDPGGLTRPWINPEPLRPTLPCAECRGSGAVEIITHPRRRRYFTSCEPCGGTGQQNLRSYVAALRQSMATAEAKPPPPGTFEPEAECDLVEDDERGPILLTVKGGTLTKEIFDRLREQAIIDGVRLPREMLTTTQHYNLVGGRAVQVADDCAAPDLSTLWRGASEPHEPEAYQLDAGDGRRATVRYDQDSGPDWWVFKVRAAGAGASGSKPLLLDAMACAEQLLYTADTDRSKLAEKRREVARLVLVGDHLDERWRACWAGDAVAVLALPRDTATGARVTPDQTKIYIDGEMRIRKSNEESLYGTMRVAQDRLLRLVEGRAPDIPGPAAVSLVDTRCAGCKHMREGPADWYCTYPSEQQRRPSDTRCSSWEPSDLALAEGTYECRRCELLGECILHKVHAFDGRLVHKDCGEFVPAGYHVPAGACYHHTAQNPVDRWRETVEDGCYILHVDGAPAARTFRDGSWCFRVGGARAVGGNRCHDQREAMLQAEDALFRAEVQL
jgi:hypothetical protein